MESPESPNIIDFGFVVAETKYDTLLAELEGLLGEQATDATTRLTEEAEHFEDNICCPFLEPTLQLIDTGAGVVLRAFGAFVRALALARADAIQRCRSSAGTPAGVDVDEWRNCDAVRVVNETLRNAEEKFGGKPFECSMLLAANGT